MTKEIGIIGVGRVGGVIAAELSTTSSRIHVADTSAQALSHRFLHHVTSRTQLEGGNDNESALRKFIRDRDLIINCTPGHIGFRTLRTIIEEKRPCIDISFFPEDPEPLQALAVQHGVEVWIDMGLAPGMSNIVGAFLASKRSDQRRCNALDLFVGGLPVERTLPLQYKAVFSPSDVIEEYLRPARIKRGGEVLSVPPLTEPEHLEFSGVGTVEAFITDGLRTLVQSLEVPNMREMTIRYPGHREVMQTLLKLGFLSDTDVTLPSGASCAPRTFTEHLLRDQWTLKEFESDQTLFLARAQYDDGTTEIVEMHDTKDPVTGYSSMARTTGFVACAAAEYLLLKQRVGGIGVHPPERWCEEKEACAHLINFLEQRNITYRGFQPAQ
ncbi:saccharopine dehydrogenase NADP-binding domain-containing protein [bacterium]|nr:saccharopine dehydrogenase NADP-binding domain-containing protein [bacterium]